MTRLRICTLAALTIALAGCANPREEARAELRGLRLALERHAKEYGRFPETIDAGRPVSATNLPHQPRSGVSVELVHAGADGFRTIARRRPWVCSMNVDARHYETFECAPLTSSAPNPPADSIRRFPTAIERRP